MRSYSVKRGELSDTSFPCLVVGIAEDESFGPAIKALEKASKGALKRLIKRGDISTKAGTTTLLTDLAGTKIERLLVIGLGAKSVDQIVLSFQSAAAQLKRYRVRPPHSSWRASIAQIAMRPGLLRNGLNA